MNRSAIRLAALALGTLALAGCGSSTSAEVSGLVTVDGKALETGTVTFTTQDGSVQAAGQIGTDGRYTVAGGEQGLPPGEYVATVNAAVVVESESGEAEAAPKLLVPIKYSDASTSDLKFTLKAGSQTIDLPLTSGS